MQGQLANYVWEVYSDFVKQWRMNDLAVHIKTWGQGSKFVT